jgi:hypothetical protein
VIAPFRVVTAVALERLSVNATLPPEPSAMMLLKVIPPELLDPAVIVCVPLVTAPVTLPPMVRRPVPEFEKLKAVRVELRMSGVLRVLVELEDTKTPDWVPLLQIVREVPPERVVATLAPKLKLLADWVPVIAMVPVLPPLTNKSSGEVGDAIKVPEVAPLMSVFQKLLIPFHVPAIDVKPAAPFESQ